MQRLLKSAFDFKALPLSWYWFALLALLLSAFLVIQQYTQHTIAQYNFPFSWREISTARLVNYGIWLLLMPTINQVVSHQKWSRVFRSFRSIVFLLIQVLMIIVLHRLMVSRLVDVINYFNYGNLREFLGPNSQLEIGVGLFSSGLELLAISAILLALEYQNKFLEQQKVLARAQLDALRMQLNPHFLFNTLHSISTLIDLDGRRAQKMITRLGSLLRKVLESDDKQLSSLEDEINFIREYLDIEQIRFRELHVKYDINPSTKKHLVPNLILQPLVENAVKYGVSNEKGKSKIHIRANYKDDKHFGTKGLLMEVENSVGAMKQLKGTGIGLTNIRQRLEKIYDHFVLETENGPSNKFIARIIIPVQS